MSASASCREEQPGQFHLSSGLTSSGLCANLGEDAILALSGLARPKSYTALQEAVTEGRPVTDVEIVTSGRFVVLLTSDQIDLHASGAFNLHLYLTGDCFGLSGLVNGGPAPTSIIAGEPANTIAIPTVGLRHILDGDPTSAAIVYRNLFAIQCRRLAALGMQ